jgi:hypothetical protein
MLRLVFAAVAAIAFVSPVAADEFRPIRGADQVCRAVSIQGSGESTVGVAIQADQGVGYVMAVISAGFTFRPGSIVQVTVAIDDLWDGVLPAIVTPDGLGLLIPIGQDKAAIAALRAGRLMWISAGGPAVFVPLDGLAGTLPALPSCDRGTPA